VKKVIIAYYKNNLLFNNKCVLLCYALLHLLLLVPTLSHGSADTTLQKLQVKFTNAPNDSASAVALKNLCWYYRYVSLDSSVKYGKKCIELAQKINAANVEAEVTRFIGISYWHYAYEEECLEWFYTSLKISERINDKSGEGYCYDNIGNSFYSQGFYDKALENFKKAKQIFLSNGDIKGVAYTLIHSSWVMLEKKQYDTAIVYAMEAIAIRKKWGDSASVSNAFKELANIYRATGNYTRAIAIYKATLPTLEKANLPFNVADHLQQMSEAYRLAGNNDSAIFFGLKSMDLSIQFNNYRQILKTAKTLQLAYTSKKDFGKALEYQNMYYENKEKLFNDRVALSLSRKRAEHDFDIKTQQLKNKSTIFISGLALLLAIAVLVMVVIYLSQRKTKIYNKLLEQKNAEIEIQKEELTKLNDVKDKMFSVVSHDIRSPLSSLQSMLDLYADKIITTEEVKELMPEVTAHVTNTASFVDNLLYWSKSQFTGLQVAKTLFNLNTSLEREMRLLEQKSQQKQITIEKQIGEQHFVFGDENMIGIVLRNLLNNALKFTKVGGVVYVIVTENETANIVCVKDNGIGMNEDQLNKLFATSTTTLGTTNEKGAGLGLILCKDFIEKNGGKIWATSEVDKGSSFYIELPKK
jgi:two-component system, sensor histidine kinase and response regulator